MSLCLSMNNEAVELIAQSDFEAAALKLKYALAIVSGSSCYLASLPSPQVSAVDLDGLVFSRCQDSSPDNIFVVFEKGFVFDEEQKSSHERKQRQQLQPHPEDPGRRNPIVVRGLVCSVILYNLALATQGMAMCTTNGSPTILLRHVLGLFEMSRSTLLQTMGMLSREDKVLFMLLLGLHANVGFLLDHFGMDQGAIHCLNSIEGYRRLALYETLPRKEKKFFNQTVVFGKLAIDRFCVAPAA